jgi:hypothetical protein
MPRRPWATANAATVAATAAQLLGYDDHNDGDDDDDNDDYDSNANDRNDREPVGAPPLLPFFASYLYRFICPLSRPLSSSRPFVAPSLPLSLSPSLARAFARGRLPRLFLAIKSQLPALKKTNQRAEPPLNRFDADPYFSPPLPFLALPQTFRLRLTSPSSFLHPFRIKPCNTLDY